MLPRQRRQHRIPRHGSNTSKAYTSHIFYTLRLYANPTSPSSRMNRHQIPNVRCCSLYTTIRTTLTNLPERRCFVKSSFSHWSTKKNVSLSFLIFCKARRSLSLLVVYLSVHHVSHIHCTATELC